MREWLTLSKRENTKPFKINASNLLFIRLFRAHQVINHICVLCVEIADAIMFNFTNFTICKFLYLLNTVELDQETAKSLCSFVSVLFGFILI